MRFPLRTIITVFGTLGLALSAPAPAARAESGDEDWGAHYDFTDAANLGRDSSGRNRMASVRGAQRVATPIGPALRFDGNGAMVIPDDESVRAGDGFTVDLWVRFDEVDASTTLFAKEGEFFARLDPPAEGGNLSLFVHAGGHVEPRVRGPKPEPGEWLHVTTTWDGDAAKLWVDGRLFSQTRRGAIPPTDAPLIIAGGTHYGPAGLRGAVADIRIHDRALTAGELLVRQWGLNDSSESPAPRAARFEFNEGAEGWSGRETERLAVANGELTFTGRSGRSAMVRTGLASDVRNLRYLSLRISVSSGRRGTVLFVTTSGVAALEIPLRTDGKAHSYVFDLQAYPEWEGELRALAVAPADEPCRASIDFVRLGARPEAPPELEIDHILLKDAINRAGRPAEVMVRVTNSGGPGTSLQATLSPPAGVRIAGDQARQSFALGNGETRTLTWTVVAKASLSGQARVALAGDGATPVAAKLEMRFAPAIDVLRSAGLDYVPDPRPAPTDVLVGCHYCPLWRQGTRSSGWERIVPFPERKPALGWYDEGDPEVADWELKWCLEHGISFFVYCWYRAGQGGPVKQRLGHAIHEGLFHAKFRDRFHFCIMWENQARGVAGVASEHDFLENLLPFWIDNYFRRREYLKVDGKPLLFIYRPEFLIDDLGGVENVRRALKKARAVCREAGFAGLTLLGEYRGLQPQPLRRMVDEGLDASFQYCWPVSNDPTPAAAVRAQVDYWKQWRRMNVLPYMLTLSMGWDSTPWHPSFSKWRLTPDDFAALCRQAREQMKSLPEDSLGRRIVLLDNWNEFGEGHYIAPHRQYGFGYLDAVRRVFSSAPEPHIDLIPEDIGRGPYDSLFRADQALNAKAAQRVQRPGADRLRGLVAWWSFDDDDARLALDYSGHGLGGRVKDAGRERGIRGQALTCDGGCVVVPRDSRLTPTRALTLSCWVKTDIAGQEDHWFINCEFGDGATGYRFGIKGGRLCFAVPQTSWSHHLIAGRPLPTGRWVHVMATYDGRHMQVFMDGRQVGEMKRTGPLHASAFPLILGNYAPGHSAHFQGALDEVMLFHRALTAEARDALSSFAVTR